MSISIDSRFNPEEYVVSVARGKYPNTSSVTAFGYSPNTQSVVDVNLWEPAIKWVPLLAASGLELLSSTVNDAAAGTGARSILVQGLDGNYNQISEVVTPNGTTVVALTNTYIAVNSVITLTAGSLQLNDGNITVRVTGAGSTQGYIASKAGASRHGRFTVPAGYIWAVRNFFIFANNAGADKVAATIVFKFFTPAGVFFQGLPVTCGNSSPIIITVPDSVVLSEKMTGMFTIASVSAIGLDLSAGFTGTLSKVN
jgi:hypothetical protein